MPEMTKTTKPQLFSSAPGCGKRDGEAYIGYVSRLDRRKMGCCWIVTFFQDIRSRNSLARSMYCLAELLSGS
jgi:hypothetical protein